MLIAVVQVLLVIRVIDTGVRQLFGFSYSPAFFAHLEWGTIRFIITEFTVPLLGLLAAVTLISVIGYKIRFKGFYSKTARFVVMVVFLCIVARSVLILNKEAWHSNDVFAAQLLIEQYHKYYSALTFLRKLTFTKEEENAIRSLGITLSSKPDDRNPVAQRPYNVIFIYLESFQQDYVSLVNKEHPGLTPNLDRFARNGIFLKNFFNAVSPTINALIFSQCGSLPQFDNRVLKNHNYAPKLPCLSDFLNRAGYRQAVMMGSSSAFSGIARFARFHHFDEIHDKDQILKHHPHLNSRLTHWGLNDLDLINVTIEKLKALKKQPPFQVTLLTMDTHFPYDIAPECPRYSKDDKLLNAIHCTDYAFGKLMQYLKTDDLLRNTAIILMGDHMAHGSGVGYGRVFAAVSVPEDYPVHFDTDLFTYTPDIAPTILELIGTNVTSLQAGKSVFSQRQTYQHLLAPTFEIFKGKISFTPGCKPEQLFKTEIRQTNRSLSACERKKAIYYIDRWILDTAY